MTDEHLHAAITELDTATQRLIGPRTGHGGHWAPSIWTQMNEAIDEAGQAGRAGSRNPAIPINLDITDWIHTIEKTTRQWAGHRDDPHHILNTQCDHRHWRPQDAAEIRNRANTIHTWCRTAEEILAPRSTMDVVGACPECQTATVWRPNQFGENCKTAALKLNTDGCVCLHCGTRWDRDAIGLLATILGA